MIMTFEMRLALIRQSLGKCDVLGTVMWQLNAKAWRRLLGRLDDGTSASRHVPEVY